MRKKTRHFWIIAGMLFAASWAAIPAEAAWIWSPDLGKWINPKKAAKDTAEEQYQWALQFFNQKDWDRAIEEFEKLTQSFPTSRLAAEGVYYTAQCYSQKDDLAKAADYYQKLIDRYPYSDRIKDAIRSEFEIANEFASGEKMKLMGMAVLPGQEKALELYNHIVKNAPYGSYGDQAQFQIGQLYKKQGEYELARKAFQALVDEYPSSELVSKARYEIANSSMLASNQAQYSEAAAQKAIEEFKEYKNAYPVDANALQADEAIRTIRTEKAEKALGVAQFYEKQRKWKSAKVYYQELIKNYPDTPAAQEAKKRLDDVIRKETEPADTGVIKMPKLPNVPKPSLPKVSLPKVSMPKLPLPDLSKLNPWGASNEKKK